MWISNKGSLLDLAAASKSGHTMTRSKTMGEKIKWPNLLEFDDSVRIALQCQKFIQGVFIRKELPNKFALVAQQLNVLLKTERCLWQFSALRSLQASRPPRAKVSHKALDLTSANIV